MVAPSAPERTLAPVAVEYVYYDPSYKRVWLCPLSGRVSAPGDVLGDYVVVGVRAGSTAFLGRPIVYVYVRPVGEG